MGVTHWIKWMPPNSGSILLNTDGAWKSGRSLASAGGLLRDSAGNWVKGFLLNIGSTDSLMAELWGVREGLILARSLEIGSLVVELDAMIVVQFLTVGVHNTHPCYTMVQDCRQMMDGGWVTEVRHIFREGNRCVNKLANLAQDLPPGIHIVDEAPDELINLLSNDKLEISVLRS